MSVFGQQKSILDIILQMLLGIFQGMFDAIIHFTPSKFSCKYVIIVYFRITNSNIFKL